MRRPGAATESRGDGSFGGAVREAARRAKNAWGAIRGAEEAPAGGALETPAAPAPDDAQAGLGGPAPTEKVVGVREEVLQSFRSRLAALHRKWGSSPDVDALLRDLAQLHPGVIRQPVGVAQQVLDMLNGQNYSGAQMAKLIETDPAIAQALLNHANADWYEEDGSPPLASLLLAARRVGARGVHAAVMSVVLEGGYVRPGAGLDTIARMVWDHMVRVAPISRELAKGFGGDPDAGFTLGLCHDAGKLLLFDRIAHVRKELRRDLSLPPDFMQMALRWLHEPLGGLSAFAWGMPPDFAAAVATHHRSENGPPPNPLSEAVFVAERLDLMVNAERDVNLKQLWAEGSISVPFETLAALFERARQGAVVRSLEERRPEGAN